MKLTAVPVVTHCLAKVRNLDKRGRKCDCGCGRPFQKTDAVTVVETPVNWFRGDDIVETFHAACYAKRIKS